MPPHRAITLLLFLGLAAPARALDSLSVDLEQKEVRVAAVAHPGRFQGRLTRLAGMAGYHLLVWEKGRAAGQALLTTRVDDRALHAALVEIGAMPGDALTMETWKQRHDPKSLAPDQHIQGTPISIGLLWGEHNEPIPLSRLLEDPGGRGFDFRFGGHLANIPVWKSGCGVCLYSCPGAKVGNATYTVRDFVNNATRFRLHPDLFPAEGTPVTLVFRLRPPPAPAKP